MLMEREREKEEREGRRGREGKGGRRGEEREGVGTGLSEFSTGMFSVTGSN